MSKWQQRVEQQVSGIEESTSSISRCHQVLQKHLWSSQVYRAIINLTLTHPNAQVVLLAGEIMIMIMKVTDSRWKEFSRCHRARPRITNHPFQRLNQRLQNYNPTRPWTEPEPRCNHHSPPHRARSYTLTATRPSSRRSRSVSFARNNDLSNRSNNVSRSPV